MGSLGKAIMIGFICRLCSKQRKIVIHLYRSKAKKLDLLNKIKLLPITFELRDNLPKTICETCIEKVEMQYQLVKKTRESNLLYQRRFYHSFAVNCDLEPSNREND